MSNLKTHSLILKELKKLNSQFLIRETPSTSPLPKIDLKTEKIEEDPTLFYFKQKNGAYILAKNVFYDPSVKDIDRNLGGIPASKRFPYTYINTSCIPPTLNNFGNIYDSDFIWKTKTSTPPCFSSEKKKNIEDNARKQKAEYERLKKLYCNQMIKKQVTQGGPMGAEFKWETNPYYNKAKCDEIERLYNPPTYGASGRQQYITAPGTKIEDPNLQYYQDYTPENLLNPKKEEPKPWYEDLYDWCKEHPFLTELSASLIIGVLTGGQSLVVQAMWQAGVGGLFAIPQAIQGDWTGFALALAMSSVPVGTRLAGWGVKKPLNFVKKYGNEMAQLNNLTEVNRWVNAKIAANPDNARLILKAVMQIPGEVKLTMKQNLGKAFIKAVEEGSINLGKLTFREKAWWRILLIDGGLQFAVGAGGTLGILWAEGAFDKDKDLKAAKELEQELQGGGIQIQTVKQSEELSNQRKDLVKSGDYIVTHDPKKVKAIKDEMDSYQETGNVEEDFDNYIKIVKKHNPTGGGDTTFLYKDKPKIKLSDL